MEFEENEGEKQLLSMIVYVWLLHNLKLIPAYTYDSSFAFIFPHLTLFFDVKKLDLVVEELKLYNLIK